jgi:hypothetical protein
VQGERYPAHLQRSSVASSPDEIVLRARGHGFASRARKTTGRSTPGSCTDGESIVPSPVPGRIASHAANSSSTSRVAPQRAHGPVVQLGHRIATGIAIVTMPPSAASSGSRWSTIVPSSARSAIPHASSTPIGELSRRISTPGAATRRRHRLARSGADSALAIVGGAGDRIGEHLVRRRQSQEDERRVGAGAIGVPAHRELVVRAADVVDAGVRRESEDGVELIGLTAGRHVFVITQRESCGRRGRNDVAGSCAARAFAWSRPLAVFNVGPAQRVPSIEDSWALFCSGVEPSNGARKVHVGRRPNGFTTKHELLGVFFIVAGWRSALGQRTLRLPDRLSAMPISRAHL